MKKSGLLLISSILISLFLVNLVAAYDLTEFKTDFADFMNDGLKPLFQYIIGGEVFAQGFGAEAILMLLLVFLVIFGILSPMSIFGGNEWINAGIALIVSILGIRFLPTNFISLLATPASALVAMIVAGVPLLLLLAITNKKPAKKYAKPIWWVYTALMAVIAIMNLLKDSEGAIVLVFAIAAGIGIIMALFLANRLRLAKTDIEGKSAVLNKAQEEIENKNQEIVELNEKVASGVINAEDLKTRIREKNSKIKALRSSNK